MRQERWFFMNIRTANSKKRKGLKRTLSPAQEHLFDQIVNELAAKKSIPPSRILETQQKPRFLHAAERRGRELGIASDEVLSGDLKTMRESTYPTPDCLTPDELEHFRSTGGLPNQRDRHLSECEICRTLVEVTTPDPVRVEEILEEVRSSTFAVSTHSKIASFLDKLFFQRPGKVVEPAVGKESEKESSQQTNEYTEVS